MNRRTRPISQTITMLLMTSAGAIAVISQNVAAHAQYGGSRFLDSSVLTPEMVGTGAESPRFDAMRASRILQPPPGAPMPTDAPPAGQPSALSVTSSSLGLASIPNMIGDFFISGRELSVVNEWGEPIGTSDLGGGRMKIAENNGAVPQDRVFFLHHHFHNALEVSESGLFGPAIDRRLSLDQYTLGLEKTFGEGWWSVEARTSFRGTPDFIGPNVRTTGDGFSNISISLKRLIVQGDDLALAGGLCVNSLLGGDVQGRAAGTTFRLSNDAVYVLPYIAFVYAPCQTFFYNAFVQLDIPLDGNEVQVGSAINCGKLTDQTLLYADVSGGCWLWRNPDARLLSGLAAICEFHYATALQHTDTVVLSDATDNVFTFTNPANRIDVTNLAAGLHVELGTHMVARVTGVFPLQQDDDRQFDAEVQVSLDWRF